MTLLPHREHWSQAVPPVSEPAMKPTVVSKYPLSACWVAVVLGFAMLSVLIGWG